MANPLAIIVTFFLFHFFARAAELQSTVPAEVVGEFPYVYAQPDFDAPVISTLKPGSKVQVSRQVFVYDFRRIQIPSGAGYVASSEIRLLGGKSSTGAGAAKKKEFGMDGDTKKAEKAPRPTKPIAVSRFQGLIFETQNYIEDTMSKTRSENLVFFGWRVLGFNTLFSGQMSTDLSILYHSGAPSYYEKITGNSASGRIINAQFTFDTLIPVSHNWIASYGFGPVIKYSHFEVNLKNEAGVGTDSFVLDDFNFGALLRLGAGFRVGRISLRADAKYYFETKQYIGVDVSTLFEF